MDERRQWIRLQVGELSAALGHSGPVPVRFVEEPTATTMNVSFEDAKRLEGPEIQIGPAFIAAMSDPEVRFRIAVLLQMASPDGRKWLRRTLQWWVGLTGGCFILASPMMLISFWIAIPLLVAGLLLQSTQLVIPILSRRRNFLRCVEVTGDKKMALKLLSRRKRPTGTRAIVRWKLGRWVDEWTINTLERNAARQYWRARSSTGV